MPTITATTFPNEAYVRVDVSWADVPAVKYARVWRINTLTGEEVLLHPYVAFNGAGDLLLNCSEGVWWDTDPPLNTPVQYRTEAADVLTNLAANSSFEAGTAPWIAANGTLAQSATFAHAGANSGRLTPNGTSFSNRISQSTIAVDQTKDVTASAWALSAAGWNSVRLRLQFFNGTTQLGADEQTPIEILDDAEWRFLTITATPPENTTVATITMEVSGTAPGANLFYFDQVELAQYQPVASYALSAVVTVAAASPWYLKDTLNPCSDQAMTRCMPGPQACSTAAGMMVQNHAQREQYPVRTKLLAAENRTDDLPMVRPMGRPETVLSIITRTFADRDSLLATLAPGTILFIQGPPEYGIPDRYISVTSVGVDAATPDKRIPPRFFTLPYRTQVRPYGPMNGPCGARVDDLCDIYTTWAALALSGLTWRQLIYGAASRSGPGQSTAGWRTFDDVKAEFANFNAVNTGGRTFTGLLTGA